MSCTSCRYQDSKKDDASIQGHARRFRNPLPDEVGERLLLHGCHEDWSKRLLLLSSQQRVRTINCELLLTQFHYKRVLLALKAAKQRGVDVRIIFDHRKASPGEKNDHAVRDAGISSILHPAGSAFFLYLTQQVHRAGWSSTDITVPSFAELPDAVSKLYRH